MMSEEKLSKLLKQIVLEMGAAANVPLITIGDKLGLYEAFSSSEKLSSDELAEKTNTSERYIKEWLSAQAASGYIEYDKESSKFFMTPEQKAVFADKNSPVYLTDTFYSFTSLYHDEPKLLKAFKSGKGISWGDHNSCLYCGAEKFTGRSYSLNIVSNWIPSITGMQEKLENGARVVDVGCGHATSTLIMAKAYPNSHFIGIDYHKESIKTAELRASEAELKNIEFKVDTAKDYSDKELDLITFFDCLHDMGDPVGVCAHAKNALKPGGSCMFVEPFANDLLEDNLNPVGRSFYAFSTQLCVPCSLNQEVGLALGSQAGLKKLISIIHEGGFDHVKKVSETPFKFIIEAKK